MLAGTAPFTAAQGTSPPLDFTFTALGRLGGLQAAASGINDQGDIVGWSWAADQQSHATLWHLGQVIDLGAAAGSSATAINNNGVIVGGGGGPAFQWRHGVILDLPYLEFPYGLAMAINDHGVMVGSDDTYAVLWTKSTETQLAAPGDNDGATGINEKGEAVGYADARAMPPSEVAILITRAGTQILPGPFDGIDSRTSANAINNHRQVVGRSRSDTNAIDHATRWDHDTPALLDDGGAGSNATAINDHGWAVGYILGSPDPSAVLWVGAQRVDLEQFIDPRFEQQGWRLTRAYAVNNLGWIVGQMTNQSTRTTAAWLLTPR
jgi:probable HAF family extracellular repeat protein